MSKLRWHIFLSLLVIHLAAFVGWIFFSWEGVICCIVLYFVTVIGITAGYHRLLTHDSFEARPIVRWALTIAGAIAGQGSPIEWVATHRNHHAESDKPDDPHSPHHGGFLWAHLGWMCRAFSNQQRNALYEKFAGKLMDDRFLCFISRGEVYATLFLASFPLIGGIGYIIGGWRLFWSFLAYGVFIRLVLVYHVTWAVNSATHLWGYRNHETKDQSRNLWWVALLTLGEGWHNNHHAFPKAANNRQRWWEVDVTYLFIWMLTKLRLAWNVSHYKKE